jgi:hypothetical protein
MFRDYATPTIPIRNPSSPLTKSLSMGADSALPSSGGLGVGWQLDCMNFCLACCQFDESNV